MFRADIRILAKDSTKIVKEDFIANLGKGDILVEIIRVEVVLLIGGHWPPIKLIDLINLIDLIMHN